MPLTDRQRHDAYEALAETFADRTDLVIEMLRTDHDHLVTKHDLALVKDDLTASDHAYFDEGEMTIPRGV